MTKQYFIELAEYNIWANNIVINWLQQLSQTQWTQNIASSFNSIEHTVLHIVSAEKAWLDRFENKEMVWLANDFNQSKNELIILWQNASLHLKQFIEKCNEVKLMEKLTFTRLNGDVNVNEYYQLIAHVFNHSTYHRGQLVTMLRQANFTNIESTDLLKFYQSNYNGNT